MPVTKKGDFGNFERKPIQPPPRMETPDLKRRPVPRPIKSPMPKIESMISLKKWPEPEQRTPVSPPELLESDLLPKKTKKGKLIK